MHLSENLVDCRPSRLFAAACSGVLCMVQHTDTDITRRSLGGDPTQQSSLMGTEPDEDLEASGGR